MDSCALCGKEISELSTQYCSDCAQTAKIKNSETCRKCKWHLYNGCLDRDCSECVHSTGLLCVCSLVESGEVCKYYEE